ncbi:NTP transferase domain-containing protein [Patescibacteria group bacterium]|nr:NTP transferase domain-containing protein [Patescibacteria group bacterium]MCL5409923.1 NTP transferase domain-containing protein [Patescibacteria group bacterium]
MDKFPKVAAIVLAGGKGTRMNSDLPKVLHKIQGKPIVSHTILVLEKIGLGHINVVTGYKAELVKKTLGKNLNYSLQSEPLGTGHAVLSALPSIPKNITDIIVINGDDSAFYRPETISNIIRQHQQLNMAMTIVTTINEEAAVSGRVIRNQYGKIIGVKANSKLTPAELASNHEMVCGLYLFKRHFLEEHLPKVEFSPKGEYNITALISTAIGLSELHDIRLENPQEWQSINTQRELQKARKLWKSFKG